MFSSSQRSKRKRGVILSPIGWERLTDAQTKAENKTNRGIPYTLEDLNELTGLSAHTLTKVRRRQNPVDRQTLIDYFQAFSLTLTDKDYIKPIPKPQANSIAIDTAQKNILSKPAKQSTEKINSSQEVPTLPEGQVPLDSSFYINRPIVETNCYETVLRSGSLIRIKAPRRMGKTSLMVRILDRAAQQGCQTVFLSMNMADRDMLQNLDKFLQWFSASVGLGMHLPNRLSGYWDELFGSKISCKIYFEQYLLAKTDRPLVLALDDVDRLFDYPELADEFFGLLRTWHEQAKNRGIWKQLRLIVAHSTEVYIPLNTNKSPFNVGLPIELKPFAEEQIEELATKYSLQWSRERSSELMAITNGQPYLVQLGLYSLWQNDIAIAKLLEQAISGVGIYANHLQRLLWTLEQDPKLASAFNLVLSATNPIELELVQAFKLESLGLVSLQGNQAIPSCTLYLKYFCDRLNNG